MPRPPGVFDKRANHRRINFSQAKSLSALPNPLGLWLPYGPGVYDIATPAKRHGVKQGTAGNAALVGTGFGMSTRLQGTTTNNAVCGWHKVAADSALNAAYDEGTVAVWFFADTIPANTTPVLVSRGDTSTFNNGFGLNILNSGGALDADSKLYAYVRSGSTTTDTVSATFNVKPRRLHHGCFTWQNAGVVNVYCDGKLGATNATSVAWTFNAQDLMIGTSPAAGGGFFYSFTGKIFRVDWYNRALTADRVAQLAQSPTAMLQQYGAHAMGPHNAGFSPLDAAWQDRLEWAQAAGVEPGVADSLNWNSLFEVEGTPHPPIDVSWGDTLTWAASDAEEANLNQSLAWSDSFPLAELTADPGSPFDPTDPATPPVFLAAGDVNVLYWSDRFDADSGDLAAGRYRR